MHTLAFVNQKGGCGKTTTAVNLAGALARGSAPPSAQGRAQARVNVRANGEVGDTAKDGAASRPRSRVLVVDLDPQAHATMALGCAVDGDETLADVLLHGAPVGRVVRSVSGGIALLPASLELAEFEAAAVRVLHSEGFLERVLADVGEYDFVLIDCPPRADGILTANALRACDTAVLVVETGAFALQGALRALGIFEEAAEHFETEFDLRVLGTLFDRRVRLARELLIGTQSRFGSVMFDTVIHESVRLREAPAFGVPVQVLDPSCRAVQDFDALAEEVRALVPSDRVNIPRFKAEAFQGVSEQWTG